MYFHFLFDESIPDRGYTQEYIIEKYETIGKICRSIPPKERNRRDLRNETGDTETVGAFVELLLGKIISDMHYNKLGPRHFMKENKYSDEELNIMVKSGGMGVMGKLISANLGDGAGQTQLNDILFVNHVPEINSKTIDRIKSLPELEV